MTASRRGARPIAAALALGAFVGATSGCRDASQNAGATSVPPAVAITSPLGVPMVVVPGGTFRVGVDGGRPEEGPAHDVTLDAFVIDTLEVNQALLAKLQVPDPSQFKGAARPVEQVRWSDAALIANERSRAEGLEPCYDEGTLACDFTRSGYRLPTEAEWEYACRAGVPAAPGYGFDGGESALRSHACYAVNSGKKTRPGGEGRANAWGIQDLHGNVAEWCHDVWSADYYAVSPARDPRGPDSGGERVIRGGSWFSSAAECRATRRWHADWGTSDACFANNTVGFRLVRRATAAEHERLAVAARGD